MIVLCYTKYLRTSSPGPNGLRCYKRIARPAMSLQHQTTPTLLCQKAYSQSRCQRYLHLMCKQASTRASAMVCRNVPVREGLTKSGTHAQCWMCHLVEDFVVPLELPAIDPKLAAALSAAEVVAQPDDDLTEEEQKKLEAVGWRMLNLPLIVCHSANGMPFFFPLQKVALNLKSIVTCTND